MLPKLSMSKYLEFSNPMPVKTPLGDGMAIYARDGGTFCNDVWAVVLNNGTIRHFRIDQLVIEKNLTFDIKHESNS
jgi:hypothetical protein